jgi:hypothetical protein
MKYNKIRPTITASTICNVVTEHESVLIKGQNFYCLYLLGILTEYLILYFGRFVAFSC